MFLDVHELALHKARIRRTYAPGTLDLHSAEFRQVEPLEVRATAELMEGQIRITGNSIPGWNWCARGAWIPWLKKWDAISTSFIAP